MTVDVSTLGWGTVQNRRGDAQVGAAFTLTNLDTLAVTSGTTDVNGQINATLPFGKYTLAVGGVTKTVNVSDTADVAVIKEAPLNPMDPRYGAVGDGVADDTAAFNAVIAHMGVTGGEMILPSGKTFLLSNWTVSNLLNLTILGYGATVKRKKSGSPDGNPIGQFSGVNDLRILGLRYDVNNVEQFGGWAIANSAGVWVKDCHMFDSSLQATWPTFDHYTFIVQTSTDVHFEDNTCLDAELIEANNCDGVWVTGNTIVRPAGTSGIIWASVANGYYARNYWITDNKIIDPRKKAIAFQSEGGGISNNEVTNVVIARNQISYLTTAGNAFGDAAVLFGDVVAGSPTGNTYRNVDFDDNTIFMDPALAARTTAPVAFLHDAGNTFTKFRFRGNLFHGKITGDWAFDLRRLADSRVESNEAWGTLTHGIALDNCSKTYMLSNRAFGSTTSLAFTNTQGGNIVDDNFVASATPTKFAPVLGGTDLVNP